MYEELLNMPRPVSRRHAPMTLYNRAAQFAPFSALTGLDGELAEAGRLTLSDTELAEDRIEELDRLLREAVDRRLPVRLVRFVPDGKKTGGALETVTGFIKKADSVEKALLLENGLYIPLWTIREIAL